LQGPGTLAIKATFGGMSSDRGEDMEKILRYVPRLISSQKTTNVGATSGK